MFVRKSTYEAKVKECEALRDEIIRLQKLDSKFCVDYNKQADTIREMADTIRGMDQLIYQMSQCPDWPSMRPLFNKLQANQESRQRAESSRINSILRNELLSIYTKEPSK